MQFRDYYQTLGVDKKASASEIKNAYRKLAKKYHPDLNPGDEAAAEQFKSINEAYEVLSDEEKRKQYDMFGANTNFTGGQNFDPSQYGFSGTYTTTGSANDFSDFFNAFFGGGSGAGGGFSMSDLFGGSTGRGQSAGFSRFGGQSARPRRPSFKTEVHISLEEAMEGTTRKLNLDDGTGSIKTIDLKVPAGLTPGKKIRVKGDRFGLDADILASIKIDTGDRVLEGLNVTGPLEVYPWEAALGSQKTAQTLQGKVKLTIPQGAQAGRKMRVPGQGFKDSKGKKGDYIFEVKIINPAHLTDQQRKLYEQLAQTV